MAKKIIISLFIFLTGVTYSGFSQGSAQATMRVSVNVMKGASIEAVQPNVVSLSQSEKSELGKLELNGVNPKDVLVNFSDMVKLTDSNGNQIDLDITEKGQNNSDGSTNYSVEGSSGKEMNEGFYNGRVTATIQYL